MKRASDLVQNSQNGMQNTWNTFRNTVKRASDLIQQVCKILYWNAIFIIMLQLYITTVAFIKHLVLKRTVLNVQLTWIVKLCLCDSLWVTIKLHLGPLSHTNVCNINSISSSKYSISTSSCQMYIYLHTLLSVWYY